MTFTKVLDVSDVMDGVARLSLEKSDGERLSAALSVDQIIYFHARLEAIRDKLSASEKPFG